YKKGALEDYLGRRGLQQLGKKNWRQEVEYCVGRLVRALHLDDVVLGGGNVRELKTLPEGCRGGDNVNAFLGGFRLWEDDRLTHAHRERTLIAVEKKSRLRPIQKIRFIEKDTTGAASTQCSIKWRTSPSASAVVNGRDTPASASATLLMP